MDMRMPDSENYEVLKMATKKSAKGGVNAKAKGASDSLPADQQNISEGVNANTGAGDSNQSVPGANDNAGGTNVGTAGVETAQAGSAQTDQAAAAETARLAEEQRKQEAARIAQQQAAEAAALALAAQQGQQKKEIPALFITSRADSFRRCGFRFSKEPLGIALECLSEEQIEVLKNEPNLIVEEVDALIDDLQVTGDQ